MTRHIVILYSKDLDWNGQQSTPAAYTYKDKISIPMFQLHLEKEKNVITSY